MNGMVSESDKLYLDQAHAKVMDAEVNMQAMMSLPAGSTDWMSKAKALQTAVLRHAKEDEEANLFPKLRDKLDARMNAALTSEYAKQFASVKPA